MPPIYVGVTDPKWFTFLRDRSNNSEGVNFWQPSGKVVKTLSKGAMWVFKLKAPYNKVGGFGIFNSSHERMPAGLAWDSFQQNNGVETEERFLRTMWSYRATTHGTFRWAEAASLPIGCQLITGAVFFRDEEMFEVPGGWAKSIVTGKYVVESDPNFEELQRLCMERAARSTSSPLTVGDSARYGSPYLIQPRAGQGVFRLSVIDAYERQCAVTREHSLPVLEAAHIQPYANGGSHNTSNGLLLRTDIHRLFDRGYVTIDENLKFKVSSRLREEFNNGRHYYDLEGRDLVIPDAPSDRPDPVALEFHRSQVFLD